ncbi:MAG: crotonase/enoyl-CoA hydratase family protein [Acidimicrobiales bacterium]|jgi:enoyl-CoA hydratase/carnithine racemase
MTDRVTISIDNGIADVRLNRVDKLNALDNAMFRALLDAGEQLANDGSIRAVVLSGNGAGFCAGLDFEGFAGMAGGGSTDPETSLTWIGQVNDGAITHQAQQICWQWREMPAPVIAAVHGVALGGGCQLALGADIRVVAPDSRMSVMESRWGLSPDMTVTQTLIELVGIDVAKDLTFTARMVSGTEAVSLGLATAVAEDPHAAAMERAEAIAARSPHAMRAIKRMFNEAAKRSHAEGLAAERSEIAALIGQPNQVEAVMSYFEKREANYVNPDNADRGPLS